MLLRPLVVVSRVAEVVSFVDELLDRPANIEIFCVAFDVLESRMDRMNDSEKGVELAKRVERFASYLREFDCYHVRKCFEKWFDLLQVHLGPGQAFEIMTAQMYNQSQRFFPLFCAFAREMRLMKAKDEVVCHRAIARVVMQERSDTRICAFEMLHGDPQMREVLDIALLETEVWSH
jgi:hypothetical protein